MSELVSEKFNPKDGDFYSKGLYQWLKKNPRYNRIVKATWNSWNGHDPSNPVLMIGKLTGNSFSGNKLRAVCRYRGDRTVFAFHGEDFHIDEWEDVTDWFIEKYIEIGACAIHGDSDHKFSEVDENSKICARCGMVYKRTVRMVESINWEKQS